MVQLKFNIKVKPCYIHNKNGKQYQAVHVIPNKIISRKQVYEFVEAWRKSNIKKFGIDKYESMIIVLDETQLSMNGWISGSWSRTATDITYFRYPNDYEQMYAAAKSKHNLDTGFMLNDGIEEFIIMIREYTNKEPGFMFNDKMGSDNKNDCVFNAMSKYQLSLPWKTPKEFKQFIGVNRNDKIPFTHEIIEKIENALNNDWGMTVYKGTESYITKKSCKYIIELEFTDDDHVEKATKIKNPDIMEQTIEKQFKMYKKESDDKYLIIGKNGTDTVNEKTFKKYLSIAAKNREKSYYHYIEASKREVNGEIPSLEIQYQTFIDEVNKLKKLTNGKINFYKTGNVTNTALFLFSQLTSHLNVEFPDPCEQTIVDLALFGAVSSCNEGYEGEGHRYDFTSYYPYHLSKNQSNYPIKAGIFKKIIQQDFDNMKYPEYGYYHAILHGETKFFRFNKDNWYTHIDLETAKQYNLKVEIINDGCNNFYHYPKESLGKGNLIFGEYVTMLFDLKNNHKIKLAKLLLNTLTGLLACHIKETFIPTEQNQINDNFVKIKEVWFDGDDMKVVGYDTRKQIFKNPYCRVYPFLLAIARKYLLKEVKPNEKSIEWLHTDGFISNSKLNIDTSKSGLGKLTYDYAEHIKVYHVNKVTKFEDNNESKF